MTEHPTSRTSLMPSGAPRGESAPRMFDVAIVGCGPTGMVAASALGRLGHQVALIERWTSLYGLPRLTHIDDETARIVQLTGDVETALADAASTEYRWVNGQDETLLEIHAAQGRQGYPAHLSIYQPDIEASIYARLAPMPNVELFEGWSLTALSRKAGDVELSIAPWVDREIDHDRVMTLAASYVIGADGSRSTVRGILGVGRDDFGSQETWLNVDVEWLRERDDEHGIAKQFCDPARGHMYMGIGRHRERFEFAILEGDDPAVVRSEEWAWKLLRHHHGLTPADVRIQRRLTYTFEARIAHQWRVDNVLLAGDAAHTTPPYLGQGACSGMRDGLNLAWKLAAVLDGRADAELLKTYEVERKPHVSILTHGAVELGKIANMTDPAAARLRDAAFKAGEASPPPEVPPLIDGVLWHSQRDHGVPVGSLTVQGRLRKGDRTALGDDILGFGFALISVEDIMMGLDETARWTLRQGRVTTAVLGQDVEDVDGVYGSYLSELGAVAILVRPDFVLFGIARTSNEVNGLLAELASQAHLTKVCPLDGMRTYVGGRGPRSANLRGLPGE